MNEGIIDKRLRWSVIAYTCWQTVDTYLTVVTESVSIQSHDKKCFTFCQIRYDFKLYPFNLQQT